MLFDLAIQENYLLKPLTTFKIGGPAKFFFTVHTFTELTSALRLAARHQWPLTILGGGSNVLLSDRDHAGLVLQIQLRGVELIEENAQTVLLKVAAGEPWHDVVTQAVAAGWWGIENLAAIPGTAGAFAIQNVGAYGQEASAVVEAVEVYRIATGTRLLLKNAACQFAYRRSIFNSTQQGEYLILATFLRLRKQGTPCLAYADVQAYFQAQTTITLEAVRQAVIEIRRKKLPDPAILGNAGSFFKNARLSEAEFMAFTTRLKREFAPAILSKALDFQQRAAPGHDIKIPTAFLLDICELKGRQIGGAAIYEKQPLIIVNATGAATAADVMRLMQTARQTIFQRLGLVIQPEPHFIGFTPSELDAYFEI